MSDKVFVVTEGEYSGYQIIGVFSSMEKATEFCPAAASGIGSARIEEYPLDVLDDDEYLQETFKVCIDVATGNSMDHVPSYSCAELHHRNYHLVFANKEGLRPHYGPFIHAESVVSAEHALKIAAEHRQMLLREKAFTPTAPL